MSYSTASPTAQPSFGKMSEPPTTLKLLVIGQFEPLPALAATRFEVSKRVEAGGGFRVRAAGEWNRIRAISGGQHPPYADERGVRQGKITPTGCTRLSAGATESGDPDWHRDGRRHLQFRSTPVVTSQADTLRPRTGASSVGKSSLLLRFTDETFLSPDETSGTSQTLCRRRGARFRPDAHL